MCDTFAWQLGDIMVICDSGALCHMYHSSNGMLNYHDSKATRRMANGARCLIEGYGDLPLTS